MRRSAGSGFTLLEVLLASFIVASALGPIFVLLATTLAQARASQPSLCATALAAEVAEQVRTLPFATLPMGRTVAFRAGTGGTGLALTGRPPVALAIGVYPFALDARLTLEPLDPPDRLARLTLVVRFTEATDLKVREIRHVELIENRREAGEL